MTSAASRRRGAAVLVLALLVALLSVGVQARRGGAQVLCEDEDGQPILCPSTTTEVEDTTSTLDEETTTTEDTVDDTETTEPEGDDEEVVTATTLTVSTLQNVLIPGDGTEGAESTTTTAKALASGGDGLSDETLILLVVGGLGLVAAVVSLLTWRYWAATRPTIADGRHGR